MTSETQRLREIVRSKDPMTDLCKERLITPEACDWVKYALDPFHDQVLQNLRGYPDVATEPTVVVKIRQAITISAPPGLPVGDNWDCHMVLSPIDFAPRSKNVAARVTPMGPATANGSYASGAGLVQPVAETDPGLIDIKQGQLKSHAIDCRTGRMDGLVINSVPSNAMDGQNQTFTPGHTPLVAGSGYEVQNVVLDDYIDFDETDLGVYRLVYSGFEVVNTTAQIAKQGAVTVYEYGNSFEVGASSPADGGLEQPITLGAIESCKYYGSYRPTTYFRSPPNNIAEAKIMPGAHSWAAQDGCYNTAKFQSDNPFQAVTKRPWAICQNNQIAGADGGYLPTITDGEFTENMAGSYVSEWTLGTQVTASNMLVDVHRPGPSGPAHFSRMNTTGAYFTGLSGSTTLFVTWRCGIERLPAANKPTFLALAQPSAAFDPNALVLYNMVANILPPGCPQGYNDAGSWFRWISDAARKSIPAVYPVVRVASMLANTMGRPVIGGALNALATTMKPVAEDISARRLQRAARQAQANRQGGKQKASVGNWQQPTPKGNRKGGTNGLR